MGFGHSCCDQVADWKCERSRKRGHLLSELHVCFVLTFDALIKPVLNRGDFSHNSITVCAQSRRRNMGRVHGLCMTILLCWDLPELLC